MKYKKNFLSNVILRFDFAPVPALLADKKTPFSDAIKERFPAVNANQASAIQFTFGPTGSNVAQQPRGWVWTHSNEKGSRKVTLGPDHLVIEYASGEYEDFAEFRGVIEIVLAAFQQYVGAVDATRIGLRYIDEIQLQGEPLNWDGVISPALVTSIKAGLCEEAQMTRSMHQVISSINDLTVIFSYGINNPDFPSPVARRLFVLDYDVSLSGAAAIQTSLPRIIEMNSLCEKMFEASIENGLRTIMEVIPT